MTSRSYRCLLVALLAVLWSCSAKLDMEGDIVDGQETAVDWMTPLPDDTPLARLSIPGAHDAVTSTVTALTAWTRTQDLNVARLWNCGVRAFDLRPAWVDGTMGIYHDKYSNTSPFWVQDYYHPDGKDDKWREVKEMLDNTAAAAEPYPLVINHASGYVGSLPDYRSNARDINALAAEYIQESGSPAGIVMMDFAGVARSRGVKVCGDILVKAIIGNN